VSLADRRWLRIFTLCVLYVAQGIPWGFMATTLPGYLVEKKLDFAFVTAALSFTTLPYAFKWVWGPIIDTFTWRRFGRRRPWIIFAQAMMGLTIVAMIALDVATQVKLLAWMVFLHTVFNALQDVAVDALAVDILPDNERGRANGLMYGAKYGGGALGGVGMAKLIAWHGLDFALLVQACVLFAIMLVPLFVRERDGEPPPREPARSMAHALQQAFSLRSTLVAALLMLGINFGVGLVGASGFALFIGELKWTYDDYSEIIGGWGLLVGCVCAAAAGLLADRVGRRRLAAIAACGLAANWIVFAVMTSWWSSSVYIYASAMVETAFTSTLSVAVITLCMDLSWPRVAGSQFTAYMALSNFSTTLGYQFASKATEWWTFSGIWLVAAGIQLGVILLLLPIDPGQTRRELPFPAGVPLPRFGVVAMLTLLVFLIGMTGYVTVQKLG
jgi:PAT family beta-lactamase induction signal transducer AmpG